MLRSTIASLLVLTLAPACVPEGDDDDSAGDSETEGPETDGVSESGADEETEGDEEAPPDDDAELPMGETVTPLVLAFAGEPVRFNAAVPAAFDLTGTMSVMTDWPTSTTPWLAFDRNGNGRIDDGGELFGSATMLATGDLAGNGFVALRELDSNWDGRIDAGDVDWGRLLVWSDVDSDRVSTAHELQSVTQRELVAIDLGYVVDRRCDARGNCEVERAPFVYRNGGRELRGAVVDVHLQIR